MIEVRLDMEEWQRVLAVLSQAPWSTANPLIMKIGEQLRAHGEMAAKRDAAIRMPDLADLDRKPMGN